MAANAHDPFLITRDMLRVIICNHQTLKKFQAGQGDHAGVGLTQDVIEQLQGLVNAGPVQLNVAEVS